MAKKKCVEICCGCCYDDITEEFHPRVTKRCAIISIIALIFVALVLSLWLIATRLSTGRNERTYVNSLLEKMIMIDGHNLLPKKIYSTNERRLYGRNSQSKDAALTTISRLREGRVKAVFMSFNIDCFPAELNPIRTCLEMLDLTKRMIQEDSENLLLVTSSKEIRSLSKEKEKIGVLLAIEGGQCIDNSLSVLRLFHQLGVRYLTLSHKCDIPVWAENSKMFDNRDRARNININTPDHSPNRSEAVFPMDNDQHQQQQQHSVYYEAKEERGLSTFGKDIIKEMNRLGMLIDLTHSSIRTSLEAISASNAPVIFSHSGIDSICPHYNNVNDKVLKELGINEGLIMIPFNSQLINCANNATISHVADHIEYVRKEIGIDRVAIGTDFDGVTYVPKGLENPSKIPDLFIELYNRGWTESDLKKLAEKNILRVLAKAEEVSVYLQKNQLPKESHVPSEVNHLNCSDSNDI